jgi:hypothetical protein
MIHNFANFAPKLQNVMNREHQQDCTIGFVDVTDLVNIGNARSRY